MFLFGVILVRMPENAGQNNSEYGGFSCSDFDHRFGFENTIFVDVKMYFSSQNLAWCFFWEDKFFKSVELFGKFKQCKINFLKHYGLSQLLHVVSKQQK